MIITYSGSLYFYYLDLSIPYYIVKNYNSKQIQNSISIILYL